MIDYFFNLLPAIITGLFLYYWQRAQIERDKKRDKQDEVREEIDKVNREVNSATMELAYATAIAVTQGKTNGELKNAIKAYNEAVKSQNELGAKLMQKQEVQHV